LLGHGEPARLLRELILSLVTLLVCVVGLELVFRVVLLRPSVPRTEGEFDDTVAAFWPAPRPLEPPSGGIRLLGLADSFGRVGGADNYHYLLEDLLRSDGARHDVVNFSVPGFELADELALLRRHGPRFQPDVVVHGVFVGNDLWLAEGELRHFRGITVRVDRSLRLWPGRFLCREWLRGLAATRRNAAARRRQKAGGEPVGELSRAEFLRVEGMRMAICSRDLERSPMPWQAAFTVLDQVRAAAAEMGATYVMVIHPDQFQVETTLRRELAETFELDLGAYDMSLPQRFLRGYCRHNGVGCLDLLPQLVEAGADGGLFLPDNTHYNEAGNRLVANQIYRSLQASGLLADVGASPAKPTG
jgi:hypothetical protein